MRSATRTRHPLSARLPREGGPLLTLLRHGQSQWNREWRFTGWADVDLTERGLQDAARAGRLLARHAPPVDLCFVSALERARRTAEVVLDAQPGGNARTASTWRLNERRYGELEGMTAVTAIARYGATAVLRWRRDFHARPPRGESVADALERLLPCWERCIAPELARGAHVLVVSHKHTLKALVATLSRRCGTALPRRMPTASPLVVTFDASDLAQCAPLPASSAVPAAAGIGTALEATATDGTATASTEGSVAETSATVASR